MVEIDEAIYFGFAIYDQFSKRWEQTDYCHISGLFKINFASERAAHPNVVSVWFAYEDTRHAIPGKVVVAASVERAVVVGTRVVNEQGVRDRHTASHRFHLGHCVIVERIVN